MTWMLSIVFGVPAQRTLISTGPIAIGLLKGQFSPFTQLSGYSMSYCVAFGYCTRTTANGDRHLNTFTSVLGPEHRRRHKRIRGVHNRAFISTSPHIQEIMRNLMVSRLFPVLERIAASPGGAQNLVPIAQSLTLDCTSAFAFGIPLSLDFVVNAKPRKEWMELFLLAFPTDQASFWLREHPTLTKYLCMLGVPLVSKDMSPARRKFEAWALPKVDEAEKVLKLRDEGQVIEAGRLPVLYDAVRTEMANSQPGAEKTGFIMTEAQRRELASECLDHIGK